MERKTIREAGASFVKQEQSREAREAQQEFSKVWFSPKVLEVRYPAHDENNVNRASAQNLIGNVDFARTGVMSFGRRNGCRWRRVSHLLRMQEAITPAGLGFDEARLLRRITKDFVQFGNKNRERMVFDKGIWPEHGRDLIPHKEPVLVLKK